MEGKNTSKLGVIMEACKSLKLGGVQMTICWFCSNLAELAVSG